MFFVRMSYPASGLIIAVIALWSLALAEIDSITIKPGEENGVDCHITDRFPTTSDPTSQALQAYTWTFSGVEGTGRSFINIKLPELDSGVAIITQTIILGV